MHHIHQFAVCTAEVLSHAFLNDSHLQNFVCARSLFSQRLQQTLDQCAKVHGEMSWDLRVLASQNFLVETVHIRCLEWWHQAAHLVHDAPKRPNVWFQAVWFLSPNFGSSVVRCTSLGVKHSFLGYLRDVEVTKFCLPIRKQENIRRLHVTVQDLVRVQHLESFQNLNKNFPHEFFFQIYFWGLWVHNLLVNIWFISKLHYHTKYWRLQKVLRFYHKVDDGASQNASRYVKTKGD